MWSGIASLRLSRKCRGIFSVLEARSKKQFSHMGLHSVKCPQLALAAQELFAKNKHSHVKFVFSCKFLYLALLDSLTKFLWVRKNNQAGQKLIL